MSPEIEVELHPIVILQDRYDGIYSSGRWLAVRNADRPLEGVTRAAWIAEEGPSGSDLEAARFWQRPPSWIASGPTPDLVMAKLVSNTEG